VNPMHQLFPLYTSSFFSGSGTDYPCEFMDGCHFVDFERLWLVEVIETPVD